MKCFIFDKYMYEVWIYIFFILYNCSSYKWIGFCSWFWLAVLFLYFVNIIVVVVVAFIIFCQTISPDSQFCCRCRYFCGSKTWANRCNAIDGINTDAQPHYLPCTWTIYYYHIFNNIYCTYYILYSTTYNMTRTHKTS